MSDIDLPDLDDTLEPSASEEKPKKSYKKTLIAIGAIVCVSVLVAGGGLTYLNYKKEKLRAQQAANEPIPVDNVASSEPAIAVPTSAPSAAAPTDPLLASAPVNSATVGSATATATAIATTATKTKIEASESLLKENSTKPAKNVEKSDTILVNKKRIHKIIHKRVNAKQKKAVEKELPVQQTPERDPDEGRFVRIF